MERSSWKRLEIQDGLQNGSCVAPIFLFKWFIPIAFGYIGYYFVNYELKMQDALVQARREAWGRAKDYYFKRHEVIYRDFKGGPKKQDSIFKQSRVRPIRFLLSPYLPETLQKPGQASQAQASYGNIWIGKVQIISEKPYLVIF